MKTGELKCPQCGKTVVRARFKARGKIDLEPQADLTGAFATWTDVHGELRARWVGVAGCGTNRRSPHLPECRPQRKQDGKAETRKT